MYTNAKDSHFDEVVMVPMAGIVHNTVPRRASPNKQYLCIVRRKGIDYKQEILCYTKN